MGDHNLPNTSSTSSMGVTKLAQVNSVLLANTSAMVFLQSLIACSTAGLICAGLILENCGNGVCCNNGLVIAA